MWQTVMATEWISQCVYRTNGCVGEGHSRKQRTQQHVLAHRRVLAVINNGGGKIFERLPRLQAMSPRAVEWMTNPQAADLAGFASLWGMRHLRIRTPDDFDGFDEGNEATSLLEIIPDPEQTRLFWAAWDRRGG